MKKPFMDKGRTDRYPSYRGKCQGCLRFQGSPDGTDPSHSPVFHYGRSRSRYISEDREEKHRVADAYRARDTGESVKAITAKYTAEQLVTKRAEVKVEIQEAINNFISITLSREGNFSQCP